MNRRPSIALITHVLLFSVVLLLAGYGRGHAQEADIKAAVDTLHAAIGSLDVSKMEPLWAHDAYVTVVDPRSKSVSVGWEAVKKDWEENFGGLSELKVTQIDGPYIHVDGNVAWQTGLTHTVGKRKSGSALNFPVFETTVFEKRGGRWLVVALTAARAPQ